MNITKLPPFRWTSPLGRETPPWRVPTNPKPTSKWVELLKQLRVPTPNTEVKKLSLTLFQLWESQLIDKYQINNTNKIVWKISDYGEEVLQKLGL